MQNLFGEEITVEEYNDNGQKVTSPYIAFKKKNNYRKSIFLAVRCGVCLFCIKAEYHGKYYYKCKLMGISHSDATDVRSGCVCNLFKKEIE